MWWCPDCSRITALLILLPIFIDFSDTASLKDVLTLDTNKLVRVPREDKLYLDRYGGNAASETVLNNRNIKPEEASDPRDPPAANVGKRCIRCETGRYPYNPYESRRDDRYRDRYDDRYDDMRDRYYDRRYDPYERYDKTYDRYDRYDQRRDYYDRDRYEPSYRDRVYDRGIGYDNRGYDYRDYADGYRDRGRDRDYYDRYDDLAGRGYGRPYDYYGGGGGYASSWSYGGGRDDYRDRYADDRYRYRDSYDGYRPTSYLYGRPSTAPIPNTTPKPNTNSDSTETPGNNSG